jgi:hypothetical protein
MALKWLIVPVVVYAPSSLSIAHLLIRQRKLNTATQILLERLGLWDRQNIRAGLLSYAGCAGLDTKA